MSAPKILIQIVILGTRIFGKALYAAGKQAVQNAKHRPDGTLASDAAGMGNATSGSLTDRLTREHRLTLDEAHMILNAKRGDPIEHILQNYELLFKANSPLVPPTLPNGRPAPTYYSHYLHSKVVRARERIEAEAKVMQEEKPPESEGGSQGGN